MEREFDSLATVYGVTNPGILNQEKFDDALLVFKVNLKKYPDIANCYDSLAECYMTMGENENAIKYYKITYEKFKTDFTITNEFRQRVEEGIRTNLNELGSEIEY